MLTNPIHILLSLSKDSNKYLFSQVLPQLNFRSLQQCNENICDRIFRSKIAITPTDYYIEVIQFETVAKWITIDLRAEREIIENPFAFERVEKNLYYHIPLDPWNQPEWFQKKNYQGTNEEIAYRFFIEACKIQIKQIVEIIIASPFPVLICCKHGKDRTGIITALLHLIAETPKEKIIEDYLLSKKDTQMELIDLIFNHIENQGGIKNYLISCNLSNDQIEQLILSLSGQKINLNLLDHSYQDGIENYLKSMFTDYWKYLTVAAACKLDLFDELASPKLPEEIRQKNMFPLSTYPNQKLLEHFLKALVSLGFLNFLDGKYQNTKLAEYLTTFYPSKLKYAAILWSEEHLTAWQNLNLALTSGKSIPNHQFNDNFFDILQYFPDKRGKYHAALQAYSISDYKFLTDIIDFSKHKSILDVGGSYGILMRYIKEKYPNIECISFDLPDVMDKNYLNNNFGVIHLEGDFFIEIPKKAEAFILSRILHDWNDEKANVILKNCFTALPENGTLYIIENCTDLTDIDLSLLNLNMFIMCESFERSSIEYISLVENAGFYFESATKLNELQTILIFKK